MSWPHLSGVKGSSVLLSSSFFIISMNVGVSLYALRLRFPWVVLKGSTKWSSKKSQMLVLLAEERSSMLLACFTHQIINFSRKHKIWYCSLCKMWFLLFLKSILFYFFIGYTSKLERAPILSMGVGPNVVNLLIFLKYSIEYNLWKESPQQLIFASVVSLLYSLSYSKTITEKMGSICTICNNNNNNNN